MKSSRYALRRTSNVCFLAICAVLAATAVTISNSSPVSATGAFYVSCVNGSDSNPGTAGAPWKTLAKANAAPLAPGDQLLLARGCTWDGQRLDAAWNGTAAAPITIGAYGSGARPIVKNGSNQNFKVTGSYLVLDGLESNNEPRVLDPCGQPIGSYYGFNFAGGAHDNTLVNSVSSGSEAGVHLGATSRATKVLSNVLTGNNVMETFGTNNDLGAWGIDIISNDNEIAYNVFSDNAAVCTNGTIRRASNSLEIYAGSNNNIHDNSSFNDRVFTELGSSASIKSTNNTFANNLFVTARPDSRFIVTRGAKDATYGPVAGTTVANNTTFQTGAGSQSVVCSLGCGTTILSVSSNVLWAEEKVIYADAPFALGTNLVWNSAGNPFAQIIGGSTSGLVVANPQFADPASNNFLAMAAPTLGARPNTSTPAGPTPVPPPVASKFRILDTRQGAPQVAYTGGKPSAGQTISLQVAGRGDVPTSGVAAVTMNVVLTESSGSGFVTAWPSGQPRPVASNLNVEGVNATISTLVTVPLGADGKVNLFTQSGGHLVADVAGWLPTGTFVSTSPTRILDTRPGAMQLGYSGDRPGVGATVDLKVGGNGVPASGVSAVVLSLTATDAAGPGFVTIWPAGSPRPLASVLNAAAAGSTVSNQVTVPLGAGGKVSIFTQSGTHLVADIAGYYVGGDKFHSLIPTRVLDTRGGSGQMAYAGGKPVGGQTVSLPVLGRAGVPASGVAYVILNLTATDATAAGYVSAWPGGTERPQTSVLNLSDPGQTRANAVFAPVGADGTVALYSQSGTHLVVDVSGWLAG
ncbi:MAG: hypothetical protein QOE00_1917 [Ilumatobacteraceae bacterium]